MHSGDLDAFQEIMTLFNETYGDSAKPVSDLKMRLYWKILEDLSIEQLNQAVINLSRTKKIKTFPLPAEILEAVTGNYEDKAEAAFEIFWETVQRIGAYQSVEFQDGIIGRVVNELGGWEKACHPQEDLKWYRKTFCDLYKSFERRGVGHEPVKCIGIAEDTNINNSARFPKPIEQYQLSEAVKVGAHEKQLKLVR